MCTKFDLCVAASPKMNMSTKQVTPNAASAVTTLWNVLVGRTAITAITSSTTIEAMNPGVPVIVPVASVNHVLALLKKCPPAPIPMIRAVI